jgi:catechol 2,3-dioxygenase-like lactoylglutathione lyase family enzyme
MIDHVTLPVSDLEASRRFYERAFAPLGYGVSFGKEGVFWAFDIGDGLFEIQQGEAGAKLARAHVALRVRSRQLVDAFHRAALEAGARDNGAPGPRPYTKTYYACFVLDPDGYNIEAMIDAAAAV